MVETYLGVGWEFRRVGTSGWSPARVPGHVHDDLVRAGVIADPFYRMNERECQWVDQEDWEYRCRFDWSAKVGCPKRVLRLEGLDTVCEVSLNGSQIATHNNMFLPLEVDVTTLLRGSNELRVVFSSAVRVAESRRAEYLAKEGISPSLSTFYERSFVRKAQYMFGWDWGPRLVSCGIWKPVVLLEYDSRVTDVWARPRLVDGEWLVDIALKGERLAEPDVRFEWPGEEGMRVIIAEPALLSLQIVKPMLWGSDGSSGMYHAKLKSGSVTRAVTFGLRTIELVQEPDEWGRSFEFVLNGERKFCFGANWIPGHSFPSRYLASDSSRDLRHARVMHLNMLRVWGGGLYESDAFFSYCDGHGIMVWQDFPFACAYYPEDDAFLASVEAEVRANVRRLRNHPSLVLWCGNNECQQMHEQKWGGDASPSRCYGERIYDELLPRVLRDEDPDRPYVHGSPSGKVEGRDCNMDGVGDSHYWDVWHGRGDWKHYEESTSRFCSEFGFASSPSLAAWSKCLDRETDWAFDSEAVKWHDKTLKGYEKYISYIELHYPKVETLEDLVYYSQLNQRDAMRCAIEHFLMSESCAGALVWQLNDCWPAQSWSLVDCEGRLKPAGREVARLGHHLRLVVRVTGANADLYALATHASVWEHSHVASWGAVRLDRTGEVKLEPILFDGAHGQLCARVAGLDVSKSEAGSTAIVCRIETPLRSRPVVHAKLLSEPKEITVAPARVVCSMTDTLRLSCETPLVDLVVWDPALSPLSYSEFLPVLLPGHAWSRNALDYQPDRLVARSLAGYHEVEITRSPL